MNDGFNYSITDSVSESGLGTDAEPSEETDSTAESDDNSYNPLPDSLGNDSLLSSDTEDIEEDSTENKTDNGETVMEDTEASLPSDSTLGASDYLPELEYIDYLLNVQLDEIQSVKSVSGNSINVTIDGNGMEALTGIQERQDRLLEGQEILINLVGCLFLAIVMEFLFNSAKRVMKKMSFRKE